jgi:hypothetical protein
MRKYAGNKEPGKFVFTSNSIVTINVRISVFRRKLLVISYITHGYAGMHHGIDNHCFATALPSCCSLEKTQFSV